MFASKSLVLHLARGAIGFAAFAATPALASQQPWLALPLIAAGLVALRGCPLCWSVGLVQTIAAKLSGKRADACIDGSCAVTARDQRPRAVSSGAGT